MKDIISSLIKSKTGLIGALIVLLIVLSMLFSPLLTSWDPNEQDIMNKFQAPVWELTEEENSDSEAPAHLLGTDQLGRDTLARILYGSRITLLVAFGGTIFGVLIGVVLVALSGYFGKWVDAVIMRLVDIQLSFPFTLLALFMAAVLGNGIRNVIIIAAISSWVRYARLVRGEFLSLKEMEYVEAIRALGGTNSRIIFRHMLPNVVSPIIVLATLELAKIILMEASLSYLGLGVPVTIPTWGRMLSEARNSITSAPWLAVFPGLMISFTVLGVNLLGDWLRDYLDPKLDV